ncbi:unnamed protein product, partial [Caretta caretta]
MGVQTPHAGSSTTGWRPCWRTCMVSSRRWAPRTRRQEAHAVQGHAGAHTGDLGGEVRVPGGWDDPLPGAVFAKRCHVGRIPDASHFVSEDQPDKVNQL